MNMRKAQWLKKPKCFDEYMLHTAIFQNSGKSSVFFTVGENDKIRLSYNAGDGIDCSFIFFHTPHDTIVFSGNRVISSFFGLESEFTVSEEIREIEMTKTGEKIVFSSGNITLLEIRNPAFLSSASLGFNAEGDGTLILEAW